MRKLIAVGTMLVFVFAMGVVLAEDEKAPDKLTFEAKNGPVTFDHAKHVEAAKKDCKVCHDVLFKKDAKAPLNFKENMHKKAEADKTSCGACHVAGGKSFESKGNCQKCHVKKA